MQTSCRSRQFHFILGSRMNWNCQYVLFSLHSVLIFRAQNFTLYFAMPRKVLSNHLRNLNMCLSKFINSAILFTWWMICRKFLWSSISPKKMSATEFNFSTTSCWMVYSLICGIRCRLFPYFCELEFFSYTFIKKVDTDRRICHSLKGPQNRSGVNIRVTKKTRENAYKRINQA